MCIRDRFQDVDELLLALEVKQSLHHCPTICSLSCNEEGRLLDGTPLTEAFARLHAQGAEVVGVNCVNGPQATVRVLSEIAIDGHLSAFPNAGYPQFFEGRFLYFTTPEYFARAAIQLADRGARLIGGCCGTGPKHIAAMAEALSQHQPERSP